MIFISTNICVKSVQINKICLCCNGAVSFLKISLSFGKEYLSSRRLQEISEESAQISLKIKTKSGEDTNYEQQFEINN